MAKRRKKRRPPKGGWKKYMARLRAMKKGGKRRRRRTHTGGTMARRKRRRTHRRHRSHRRRTVRVLAANPRRRRRRHAVMHHRRYRRRHNPRFSVGGVMSRIKTGAVDGLWIVGGKAVTNGLPSLIGLSPTGALGLAIKALAAVAAGYVFGFISPNAGKLATASGFASIYEPFLSGLPVIGPALSDDEYYLSSYPGGDDAGVSSYPEAMGDDTAALAGMM